MTPKIFKLHLHKLQNCPFISTLRYYFGNRRSETLFNRFILSFTSLNSHLFQHNLVPDPSCDCGLTSETPEHYFLACPRYNQQRIKLIGHLSQIQDLVNLPFKQIRNCNNKLLTYIIDNPKTASPAAQHIQVYIEESKRFEVT